MRLTCNRSIPTQIKDSLYCFLIPTTHDDTVLMSKMCSKAVIPEANVRVARMKAEIFNGGVVNELLTPLEHPDMAADVFTEEMIKLMKEISELIFSMDGCCFP